MTVDFKDDLTPIDFMHNWKREKLIIALVSIAFRGRAPLGFATVLESCSERISATFDRFCQSHFKVERFHVSGVTRPNNPTESRDVR
jgi:hypothetical protein